MNPASLTQTFGIIGPCGTLDQVLNQVLGPDPGRVTSRPARCPARVQRDAGRGPSTPSGSGSSSTSTSTGRLVRLRQSSSSGAAPGPNSGLGGLSELLSPLLGGRSDPPRLHSKPFTFAVAAVVIAAAVIVGVELTKGKPTYQLNVVYSSAPGLFTGAAVDVLGVKVGSVTNVQNVGDKVHVTLP